MISPGIDAFLVTTLATVGPWLYFTLRSSTSQSGRRPPPSTQPQAVPPQGLGYDIPAPSPNSRRSYISIFVALHATFILYNIFVCFQENLFTLLHVPVNEPSDAIRARILHFGGVSELPGPLSELLTRLSSFDVRTYYIRFGHNVIQECEHCTSYYDYALYALPRPLLEYLREAAMIGLVTIRGSGRDRWRVWGLGVMMVAALCEAYFLGSAEITIPTNGKGVFMWHDTLWQARQILFLVLPPIIHLLPASNPAPSPLSSLPYLTRLADQTLARIQLLEYTRGASLREPELRAAAEAWWERERTEGSWGSSDAQVREIAEKLGLGVEERGALRSRAHVAAEALKGGFKPSEYF